MLALWEFYWEPWPLPAAIKAAALEVNIFPRAAVSAPNIMSQTVTTGIWVTPKTVILEGETDG